jgi:transketolase N-terminal domain/subunit
MKNTKLMEIVKIVYLKTNQMKAKTKNKITKNQMINSKTHGLFKILIILPIKLQFTNMID